MTKYRVQFHDENTDDEVIEAEQYEDVDRQWIDFLEPDPDDAMGFGARQKTRLSAKLVKRIDIVKE